MLRLIENLRSNDMIPNEEAGPAQALDLTNGHVSRWWLWVCNSSHHSRDVIGVGVHGARMSMTDNSNAAAFAFHWADGTRCRVVLRCREKARDWDIAIYI